jgi:hypothetical protein
MMRYQACAASLASAGRLAAPPALGVQTAACLPNSLLRCHMKITSLTTDLADTA